MSVPAFELVPSWKLLNTSLEVGIRFEDCTSVPSLKLVHLWICTFFELGVNIEVSTSFEVNGSMEVGASFELSTWFKDCTNFEIFLVTSSLLMNLIDFEQRDLFLKLNFTYFMLSVIY